MKFGWVLGIIRGCKYLQRYSYVNSSRFFIVLTKKGGIFLTQIMTFIQPYRNKRHHCGNMLAQAVIIVANQTEKKHETTIANISRDTKKRVVICCKSITANLLTVVGIHVEPSTSIAKPKVCLEVYISVRQPP